MAIDLFAGLYVRDFRAARAWYTQLLGSEPDWEDAPTEAVWELAEHHSIAIEVNAEHAGHALHTVIVDDFDDVVAEVDARGSSRRSVRRTRTAFGRRYTESRGNVIGFGGAPVLE